MRGLRCAWWVIRWADLSPSPGAETAQVQGVVALAPWPARTERTRQLKRTPALIVHGSNDRVTSCRASHQYATRACQDGAPVSFIEIDRGEHTMLRRVPAFELLAARYPNAVLDPEHPSERSVIEIEDGSWLRGIAWDPHDRQFVVASIDGWLSMHHSTTPYASIWRRDLHTSCFSCAISPDGTVVSAALGDGRVVLLDSETGETVRVLPGHESEVWSTDFSRDGTTLVSGGADGTVRVWSLADKDDDGAGVFSLTTSCTSVRLSPAGLVLFGSSGAWAIDPARSTPIPGDPEK